MIADRSAIIDNRESFWLMEKEVNNEKNGKIHLTLGGKIFCKRHSRKPLDYYLREISKTIY